MVDVRRALSCAMVVLLLTAGCTTGAPPTGSAPPTSPAPNSTSSVASSRPSSGPTGGPTTAVRYTFDWTCDGDWAPAIFGESKGFFAEENLEVTYVKGDGSSAALPLIATGTFDIGQIAAPPLILGAVEELPVTVVGVQQAATAIDLVAAGEIKTPKDMEGKRVGVQVGEFEGAVWQAFATSQGLDRTKIEEVPAAGGDTTLFIAGQLDVVLDYYTSVTTLQLTEGRDGEETIFLMRDYLPILGNTTAVNNSFLEANPEAVRGFMRAWAKGMKYGIDNPDEMIAAVHETCPEIDEADLEYSIPQFIDSWKSEQAAADGLLTFSDESWEATKQVLVDGDLMEDADITTLYTRDFLPDPAVMP